MTEKTRRDDAQRQQIAFELGTELFIERKKEADRLQTTVVGVLPQSCLIIKLPTVVGIENPLPANSNVQVRYVDRGEVFGFSAIVLGSITAPFPLTFLSFPQKLERTNVRRHPRVDCYIPATLKHAAISAPAIISDISRGGCRLKLKEIGETETERLRIDSEVILYFPLLGLQGVQECSGTVRNINLDSEGVSIGIEFDIVEPELIEMIGSYTKMIAGYQR
jgi:hypothetical protein